MRLLFFALIIPFFSFVVTAQQLQIVPNSWTGSNQLILISSDSLFKINPITLREISSFKLDFPLENPLRRYNLFESKEAIFITPNGSGEVRILKDSLNIRMDTSNLNNFSNASTFIHRDTIFKFGGYGYWQASRNLIYWDKTSKEWEVYVVSTNSDFPPPSFDHTYFYNDGKLIILSGKTLQLENPKQDVRGSISYTFDFLTKQWHKTNSNHHYYHGYEYNHNSLSYLFQDDQVLRFDWKNNSKAVFNSNFIDEVDFTRGFTVIYDNVYYFLKNNESSFIQKKALNEFLGQPLKTSKIYYDDSIIQSSIILLFIIVIFFLIIKHYSRKLILIEKNFIRYRYKILKISNRTEEVLSFVAKNPTFKTNHLYDFLYDSSLHPNHVYKIINYELKVIEDILQLITGNNNSVFEKTKFEKDRRITLYNLQTKHYTLVIGKSISKNL